MDRLRLASMALLVAVGCAEARPVSTAGERVAAALRSAAHCGGAAADPSVRWLSTDAEYRAALARADGALLGKARPPPTVDFEKDGVLLVEMGRRPTAGHELALATDHVATEDGVGVVRVEWTEPVAGALVAQVVTSPCLFVAVPRGGLRELKVVDQHEVDRGSALVR